MNAGAWEKLAAEKQNRQPTPPVGEPIVWFIEGDRNRPVAAQCNGIEGPGRIKVCLHQHNGFTQHRGACHHVSAEIHQRPNSTTKTNGSWDYVRGKVPKEDYALHDLEIQRREEALMKAESEAKLAAEQFQKRKAEREAMMKGRLAEILPAR